MDANSHPLNRMIHSSHLLTGLMLTATGAAFLYPLSAHHAGHRAAAPTETRRLAAISKTDTPLATRHAAPTTVPTTTPTTIPPPAVTTPTTAPAPAPVVPQAPVHEAAAAVSNGYGCAPAVAYLQVHAAPGFTIECPGWADGHQAMSCDNVAGVCPGAKVIAISTPCPAAYMNEASNSWVLLGKSNAALDPYGYCP